MGKLADIRAALATALATIDGVETSGYVKKKVSTTTLSVIPAPDTMVEFDQQFGRGSDEWSFQVEALTPLNDFVSAQKTLDDLLEPYGDRSVKQALEASTDPLLTKKTQVKSVERYGARVMPDGAGMMLGAQINVTVYASGRSS